jgi:hypothetical protein
MNRLRFKAYVRAAALGCVLAAGCSGYRDALLRRAAFDLNCPEENLTLHDLGEARGIAGCGRRATYVQRCEPPYGHFEHQYVSGPCSWVMDSQSVDAPVVEPAPIVVPPPAPAPSEPAPATSTPVPEPAPSAPVSAPASAPASAPTEPAAAP